MLAVGATTGGRSSVICAATSAAGAQLPKNKILSTLSALIYTLVTVYILRAMALHHYLMYFVPATPMGCAFAYYLYQAFLTFVSLVIRELTLFDGRCYRFIQILFNYLGPALYNARFPQVEIQLVIAVSFFLCVDLSRNVAVDAVLF